MCTIVSLKHLLDRLGRFLVLKVLGRVPHRVDRRLDVQRRRGQNLATPLDVDRRLFAEGAAGRVDEVKEHDRAGGRAQAERVRGVVALEAVGGDHRAADVGERGQHDQRALVLGRGRVRRLVAWGFWRAASSRQKSRRKYG